MVGTGIVNSIGDTLAFSTSRSKCDHCCVEDESGYFEKYGGPESLIYYTNTKKPKLSNSEQLLICNGCCPEYHDRS